MDSFERLEFGYYLDWERHNDFLYKKFIGSLPQYKLREGAIPVPRNIWTTTATATAKIDEELRTIRYPHVSSEIVPTLVSPLDHIPIDIHAINEGIEKCVKELKLKEKENNFMPDYTPEVFSYSHIGESFMAGSDKHIIEEQKKKIDKLQRKLASYENGMDIQRIVFNPPATIVFWKDGTKTVVKCQKDQEFNPYFGFCAAVAKRIYGNNSRINRMVTEGEHVKPKEKKEKKSNDGISAMAESLENFKKIVDNITNDIFGSPDGYHSEEISLIEDTKLGHYCNNCKYREVETFRYPCGNCNHISGLHNVASYWVSNECTKNHIASKPEYKGRCISYNDDKKLGHECLNCKYVKCSIRENPCRECNHLIDNVKFSTSYWTAKENKEDSKND